MTIRDGGKDEGATLTLTTDSGRTTKVAIDHTTIANSAGPGLKADRSSSLPNFEENTLTDNQGAAAELSPRALGSLDGASDYSGNGNDVVRIYGEQVRAPAVIKAINVPYSITGGVVEFIDEGTDITIEAGAIFEFAENAAFYTSNEATLSAEGTEEDPIIFRGATSMSGFWRHIGFYKTNKMDNLLRYVEIQDAGADGYALLVSEADGRDTKLRIENVTFDVEGEIKAISINRRSTLTTCTGLDITAEQVTGNGRDDAIAACGLKYRRSVDLERRSRRVCEHRTPLQLGLPSG